MRLIQQTNINFVGHRRTFFIISGTVIILSILSFVLHGGFNYGVDFTGGTLLQIRFDKPVSTNAVRSAVNAIGEGSASIQQDEQGDFFIRVRAKEFGNGKEGFSHRLGKQFKASFAGNNFELLREETVGPQISKELQGKVLLAVLLGIVGILIYVTIRFDFRFGIGAVMALIHDTIITLGFVSMFNKEVTITLIAAVLTVIGYSVNDSIVVSDRVREDMRKWRKESFMSVVNTAINRVLNRTVITSITTLFVTLAFLFLGAATVKDFAFVLTIGILVGTYSSIFVVANSVVEWETRLPTKRRR
ncbi:protein translocase subunit SecF [candidate division WOR-3 bacterium JGI_Cruoil_03_51_56]|uniref:Protein-export membrane protein SecF n=1 Tax=candidate division WOR-3 bacterium JGI_Cruoil_03_51_56 TaxID=1973747 RepID=A0A235BRQ9_UNCW3|nr:MAG: protein translocase subunit SecF [candidate division WOR-3 bacterium JGI_Cruoil_03_51_56]